jgi:hypothetical protein
MSPGGSLIAGRLVRELPWGEGKFSGDPFLLPSRITLQLVRVFQKKPRFRAPPPPRFMGGNPSGRQLGRRFGIRLTNYSAGVEKDLIFPHLILPFDTICQKMGPFRGIMGQNGNNSEVEIRPVSIDDSACVRLGEKLGPGIKSQLLCQLSYRGNQLTNHARCILPAFGTKASGFVCAPCQRA